MYNAPFFFGTLCPKIFGCWSQGFQYPIYCYTIYFWRKDYAHRIHGTGILVGSVTGYEIILGIRGWAKNMNHLLQNVSENMWATKKTLTTFHYTVCLIGILIMVYYNAYISGEYNALYTPTNHVSFHCSCKKTNQFQKVWKLIWLDPEISHCTVDLPKNLYLLILLTHYMW